MNKEKQLALIKNIHSSEVAPMQKQEDLNLYMAQSPPKNWIKKNPMVTKEIPGPNGPIKVPSEYLPIDKVELMLIQIFKHVSIEVLREGVMLNHIYCTVRIHYYHPALQRMEYHDGVGAAQIQCKKGSGNFDISQINYNAIAMALPIAKTQAIKDASHHFGPIFGSNLNRLDIIDMSAKADSNDKDEEYDTLVDLWSRVQDNVPHEEHEFVNRTINQRDKKDYKKKIDWLKQFDK